MYKVKACFLSVVFSLIFLLAGQSAYGQKGGVGFGVRLGDPTGLSIKKYIGNDKALEFNIGRSYYLWKNKGYFEDGFYRADKFKDKDYYNYRGYRGYTPISMQLHIMQQKPILDLKGLDVYFGAGPQFRFERIEYIYSYRGSSQYYEFYNDYDLGLDGVLGLEYTLSDIPVSVFLDITLFMELLNDPFLPMFQPGIGVRYNLNAGSGGKKK